MRILSILVGLWLTLLLYCAPALAYVTPLETSVSNYLAQFEDPFVLKGGWMLDDTRLIAIYRSIKTYRISLERIIGYDPFGMPQKVPLDKVDFEIETHRFVTRGDFLCTDANRVKNLVVLIDADKPFKSWTVEQDKLRMLSNSAEGIFCASDDHE
ncbi:MAG: hypothetical protein WCD18_16300 [Thermosynechococcaceae cyanobacterium]